MYCITFIFRGTLNRRCFRYTSIVNFDEMYLFCGMSQFAEENSKCIASFMCVGSWLLWVFLITDIG
jgi:hypothetical protein